MPAPSPAPTRAAARHDLRMPALLLVVALVPRILWLDAVPPRIHSEEISMGIWNRYTEEGRVPEIFGVGYSNLPLLNFAARGLLTRLFGGGLLGLRLTTVAVSLLIVLFTYGLARRLVPEDPAAPVVATLFVGLHHVTLYWSRVGYHNIDGALCLVATAYFLWRAVTGDGVPAALLAGLASGLLVQDYFSSRATPVVAAAFLGTLAIFPQGLSRRAVVRAALSFTAAFVLALGPLLLFYLANPDTLTGRERKAVAFDVVKVLRGDADERRKALANVSITVSEHSVGVDPDGHYGANAAYLHPLWLPFVAYGLWRLLADARRPRSCLLLLWGGVVLVAGAVMVTPVNVRRTFPIVPWMGILMGLAVADLARRLPRRVVLAAVAIAIAAGGADQVDLVLRRYPPEKPVDFNTGVGATVARAREDPPALFAPTVMRPDDPFLRFLAPRAALSAVGASWELAPGRSLVSALHAGVISQLARRPGAEVTWPWGRRGAWLIAPGTLPGAIDVRLSPPAVVTLAPASLAAADLPAELTAYARDGSLAARHRSPLLCWDYNRARDGALARVVLSTSIDGGAQGAARMTVWSRFADVSVALDGKAVAAGASVPVAPGTHVVEATFRPHDSPDSFQLDVAASGDARCCRAPAPSPAPAAGGGQ